MTLFKKKNKPSYIQVLLEEKYKQTKQENKTYFYFALFDRDKPDAENFCKKNNIKMFLDHSTDGNLIYKFII